jgi:methyltransferase
VDEVVIFDDGQAEIRDPEKNGYTAFADPNFFLYHVLSYLETPPHLRKALFPIHPDLSTAGALPSLDMPHHLRSNEICPYREGVATWESKLGKKSTGSMVDCGLRQQIFVPVELEPNTRVTVKLNSLKDGNNDHALEGEAVSPELPREEGGYYWGYSVRQASSLSNVFTECPHDGGYDVSIGTSERGVPIASLLDTSWGSRITPDWAHLIIVFGGIAGLEAALASDTQLLDAGVGNVGEVFDHWVNLVPRQGSRTIRTEEAVWVGLMALRSVIDSRDPG